MFLCQLVITNIHGVRVIDLRVVQLNAEARHVLSFSSAFVHLKTRRGKRLSTPPAAT